MVLATLVLTGVSRLFGCISSDVTTKVTKPGMPVSLSVSSYIRKYISDFLMESSDYRLPVKLSASSRFHFSNCFLYYILSLIHI